MEKVYRRCGTASLQRQLKPFIDWQEIQPSDVVIKGGFPGHAMIVVDSANNKTGNKIFMLAQSYMPAQDIHIVKNPGNENISSWYELSSAGNLVTLGWIVSRSHLRKW